MKLNFTTPLLQPNGEPFKEGENLLTLGSIITTVSSVALDSDKELSVLDKNDIGSWAYIISKGLDLTTDQVMKVKNRVAVVYASPILIYAVSQALEG
jgi:hypothetical protein